MEEIQLAKRVKIETWQELCWFQLPGEFKAFGFYGRRYNPPKLIRLHNQRKFRSSNFRLYWKLPVALAASMFLQQRCFGG